MSGFPSEGFYDTGYSFDDKQDPWAQQGYDQQGFDQQGGYDQSAQQQYNQYDYGSSPQQQQQPYMGQYGPPDGQNAGDPQFGAFNYAGGYADSGYGPTADAPYTGQIFNPASVTPGSYGSQEAGTTEEDEPPLLEELGINFDHIMQKTMYILNPFKKTDQAVTQDTDLAGPLVFCLMFGASLLLMGKVHFGYIYGIAGVGCVSMYALLNLMSLTGVPITCVMSVLGYCLLPMVFLSFGSLVLSLQSLLGTVLAGLTIFWCSVSASKLFVSALAMDHQQPLVAYPCALLYGVFALLTVF